MINALKKSVPMKEIAATPVSYAVDSWNALGESAATAALAIHAIMTTSATALLFSAMTIGAENMALRGVTVWTTMTAEQKGGTFTAVLQRNVKLALAGKGRKRLETNAFTEKISYQKILVYEKDKYLNII